MNNALKTIFSLLIAYTIAGKLYTTEWYGQHHFADVWGVYLPNIITILIGVWLLVVMWRGRLRVQKLWGVPLTLVLGYAALAQFFSGAELYSDQQEGIVNNNEITWLGDIPNLLAFVLLVVAIIVVVRKLTVREFKA